MSSIVNKVKDALHSDKDKSTHTTGTHSTHNTSHTGTSADPRVNPTHNTAGTGIGGTHDASYPGSDNYTVGTGGNRGTDGPATRTDGPHNSNHANKADPRVDSDRDHSTNLGANPHGTATTGTGAHNTHSTTTGTGLTGTHGTHNTHGTHGTHGTSTTGASAYGNTGINRGTDGPATRTDGPHNSNLANKADPRVDSDRDHSTNLGANPHGTATTGNTGASDNSAFFSGGNTTGTHGTHTGTHGTHATSGTHGTHVGTTGVAGTHSTHTGTTGTHDTLASHTGSGPGPAPNTAGPHKSDMMNKVDPRVDSDLDGSKTVGGNKTALEHRDPTDAAQVPPSVMQKHIGKPTIAHDDVSHDRERRHSVSHQEQHRGH